jgi:molybdopterin-guanine dinucleotide biosynthesis protein A
VALPAIGIFVGGQGRRMGGVPKGNLQFEGRSILDRTLESCMAVAHSAGGALHLYLVGDSSAYSASGVQRLADDPTGVGPMGGLRAFLREAARHGVPAVVLANDLPFLTAQLLERLCFENGHAAALAPREKNQRWQPLFARYLPDVVLPEVDAALARQATSLQTLFDHLGPRAVGLDLSVAEWQALRDWDLPSDIVLDRASSANG